MERPSEMSFDFYHAARRYILDDNILYNSGYFAHTELHLGHTSYGPVGEVVERARGTATQCLATNDAGYLISRRRSSIDSLPIQVMAAYHSKQLWSVKAIIPLLLL
jgi:hypothetical protein